MHEQTAPTPVPGVESYIAERLSLLTEHIMNLEAIVKDLRLRMVDDVSPELWS